MKSREWIHFLEEQRRLRGKWLFTVTELANVARNPNSGFSVELSRLRKYGIIQRYARGIYGLPGLESPEILLSALDFRAYFTGSFGLYRHNLISQVPVQFTAFTNRRRGRFRIRKTTLGTFRFVCVAPPIYHPPSGSVVATPEQALFDYYYLSRREGGDPKSQVAFRGLGHLSLDGIDRVAGRYPRTVGRQIRRELGESFNISEQ